MSDRIKYVLFLAGLLVCQGTQAAPARKGLVEMTQPDGSSIMVRVCGDEHCHYYMTPDSIILEEDPDGFLIPASDNYLRCIEGIRKSVAGVKKSISLNLGNVPTVGSTKGIVILAEYPDFPFSAKNDREAFLNLLNQEGYDRDGATGCVSEYYRDQSYGLFTPGFDVVGPVRLPNNLSYYGSDANGMTDVNAGRMITDACMAADDLVDFADYDNNSDGTVDLVYVIYSGYAQSNGASTATIWPHMSCLSWNNADIMLDGVKIDRYACSSERTGKDGEQITGIGLICHEFSHTLGLPDIYDTTYQSGLICMGEWDVMDIGCYNNDMRTPAGYSACEKALLGWIDPEELKGCLTDICLPSIGSDRKAFKMTSANNPNEYFMLETRSHADKWDAYLPGEGMLIIKVDFNYELWNVNMVNSNGNSGVCLVPANGDFSGSTDGPSTPFPGSSGVTVWSDVTKPSSNFTDGSFLECALTNISFNGNVTTFDCGKTIPTPRLSEPTEISMTGFRINWDRVDDAKFYMVEITSAKTGESKVYSKIVRNRFTVTDLDSDDTYTYRVRAVGDVLLSPYSDSMTIRLSDMAALGETREANFVVTARDEGLLILSSPDTDVDIYGSSGLLLHRISSSGCDYVALPKGVYIIRSGSIVRKVVL